MYTLARAARAPHSGRMACETEPPSATGCLRVRRNNWLTPAGGRPHSPLPGRIQMPSSICPASLGCKDGRGGGSRFQQPPWRSTRSVFPHCAGLVAAFGTALCHRPPTCTTCARDYLDAVLASLPGQEQAYCHAPSRKCIWGMDGLGHATPALLLQSVHRRLA